MNLLQRTLIAGAVFAALYGFVRAVDNGVFGETFREGFMLGFGVTPVRSATVLASVYWPGDGVVSADDYSTASGERYDAKAMKCACLDYPLGTKLYVSHGRNHVEVVCNDRGPFVKNRKLDFTPAVDAALHTYGLDAVRVDYWPPLPKNRPENIQ